MTRFPSRPPRRPEDPTAMHRPPARRPRTVRRDRRGSAFVEFAAVAPFFVTLAVMSMETVACMHTVHQLHAALREGGRLAAMDWDETLPGSQTPAAKIEEDVTNFLAAGGLPREDVRFRMLHAEGPREGQPFDLGAAENRLALFTMEASAPTPPGYFARLWFSDRLSGQFAFRAGRDVHAP